MTQGTQDAAGTLPIWLQAVRWIAVPFAALLGIVGVFALLKLGLWINSYFGFFSPVRLHPDSSIFHRSWLTIIANAWFGIAFVGIGAAMAPKFRGITALSLGAFYLLFTGIAFLVTDVNWGNLIALAAGWIGAISAAVHLWHDE